MRVLPFGVRIGVALMVFGACDSPAVTRAPAPSDLALGSGEVGDSVYVPRDVEDAVAVLQRDLPPAALKEIRAASEDAVAAKYHFGLGMGLRNDWGLWRGSRLGRYFAAQGVTDPEAMSSVVLLSLYRRLNGQPLRLDEQFREAKAAEEAALEAPLPPLPPPDPGSGTSP